MWTVSDRLTNIQVQLLIPFSKPPSSTQAQTIPLVTKKTKGLLKK